TSCSPPASARSSSCSPTGCRTQTSPPGCTSARRPSRATCGTSSPSSRPTRERTRWRLPSEKPSSTEPPPAPAGDAPDAEADFLESLVESGARIAATRDEQAVLERACREAGLLLDATATRAEPGSPVPDAAAAVPVRVGEEELGSIVLQRAHP